MEIRVLGQLPPKKKKKKKEKNKEGRLRADRAECTVNLLKRNKLGPLHVMPKYSVFYPNSTRMFPIPPDVAREFHLFRWLVSQDPFP